MIQQVVLRQVIGQHLGSDIDNQSLLAQTRDGLQLHVMLEPLRRLDTKQKTPAWIIDEAQNLPPEYFRDLPAFLNFAFDSRDLISIWLVGHTGLYQSVEKQ